MLPIEVIRAADAKAVEYKLPTANLAAVVEVESNGQVFAPVAGRMMPLILFEPHVFNRLLRGAEQDEARRQKLASVKWNKRLYPKTQEGRWAQLERAKLINREAALEATSYGVGQVLGLHWKALGFKSVDDFVSMMVSGAEGQIDIMVRFIMKNGLDDELRDGQWAAFARGYNGPAYKKNKYHTKMAAAAKRYAGGEEAVVEKDGMLRMGSSGKRVRELQALLVRAGYDVEVDGDFGTVTRDALKKFQRGRRLKVDGVYGPKTEHALGAFRQARDEDLGKEAIVEIKEVKEGAGSVVGGITVETAKQTIDSATESLQGAGTGLPILEWLLTGLSVVAAGLVLYGLYRGFNGWLDSSKTKEA